MKKAKRLEDGMLLLATVKQKLLVKLDDKEIAIAGIGLANLLQKHEEFLLQSKDVKQKLSQQEGAIQADIDEKAAAIRSGMEQREVDVEVRADFTRGVAEFVRTDTGETITKRTLTDNERQKKMIFDTEETDDAADAAAEKGELPVINISTLVSKGEPPAEEPPPAAA